MSLMDLLRMSSSSLKRRKLRTFLTVLGVLIGTSSIVVMISLGLGMQQSLYKQVEQSGGLTSIMVTGKGSEDSDSMMMSSNSGSTKASEKYVTDDVIKKLQGVEHVKFVAPVLKMPAVMLKGNYIANVELSGMTAETLKQMNIPLGMGQMPKENGGTLEFVPGNMVTQSFMDKSSGKGYWETGKMPDVDFTKDQIFLILDQEGYNATRQVKGAGNSDTAGADGTAGTAGTAGEKGDVKATKPPKKMVVKASGVVEGGPQSYNTHSFNVYCDLDTLKTLAKKEFSGRVMPGQPKTKSGKPYRFLAYSSAYVKVDELDNVETVSKLIRDMGYKVESNIEYVNSMKKQFGIIQAVLGGIGAVSLLVAAIGIANTMMMSIYERTKEIGVIKVLGCSLNNIKQMFLLEAAFIGLIGGIVGNILSLCMSGIINVLAAGFGQSMGVDGGISYIPPWLMLASMAFAVFIGMAAGYFPALRAMKLSPLAAINN
ncbi:ABC transporter permease [Lachnospiraceae bacterium LCP25S3_G4]